MFVALKIKTRFRLTIFTLKTVGGIRKYLYVQERLRTPS